jgi:hypothetical protein
MHLFPLLRRIKKGEGGINGKQNFNIKGVKVSFRHAPLYVCVR